MLPLEVHDLDVRYGRVHAVRGVSVTLAKGEIVAVLGANGAGKSSLLRAVLGLAKASAGTVVFDGRDISHWSTSARVRSGLVLVPEGRRIVMTLTIHENLLMGAFNRRDTRAVAAEIDEHLPALPQSGGAPPPSGFGPLGRRAADAGDRARPDRPSQGHDARRALAGIEPAPGE